MSTPFANWSTQRLAQVKNDWEKVEYWFSGMGMVYRDAEGEWKGKVHMEQGKVGRIDDSFPSAEAAMRCVERVWKREEEKRNNSLKLK